MVMTMSMIYITGAWELIGSTNGSWIFVVGLEHLQRYPPFRRCGRYWKLDLFKTYFV